MKRKLQVFVSSTFTDLTGERQAAVAAILKAGHIPAGMELFTAGDLSQMDTIKRWIAESDVYMLILGARYGSIETNTGLSYTELEYNFARQLGKPLFAIVIENDAIDRIVRERGVSFVERQNARELTKFREKVLSNISSFYSDEKDIRLCVYESLSDMEAKAELKGWIYAGDVEDNRHLITELAKSRDENSALVKRITELESELRAAHPDWERPEVMAKVLQAIEIIIPANLTKLKGKDVVTNLLEFSVRYLDSLTLGVDNRVGITDMKKFIFYNVCPKLKTHGLVDTEQVTGVQWRRSLLNNKGSAFFAHLERQKLLGRELTGAQAAEQDAVDADDLRPNESDRLPLVEGVSTVVRSPSSQTQETEAKQVAKPKKLRSKPVKSRSAQ